MELKEFDQLSDKEQEMILSCIDAQGLAFAPYSNFQVGCALWLETGAILQGANQENASYPLCLCAERVALSYAAMHNPGDQIKAIAVSTSALLSESDIPAPPCGACRQVILEYQDRQEMLISIYIVGANNRTWIYDDIGQLLPHAFRGKFLHK